MPPSAACASTSARAHAAGVRVGQTAYDARRRLRQLQVVPICEAALDNLSAAVEAVLERHAKTVCRKRQGPWSRDLRALGQDYHDAPAVLAALRLAGTSRRRIRGIAPDPQQTRCLLPAV